MIAIQREGIYQSLADNCTPNGILIVYLDIEPDVMLSRFEARGDKLRSAEEALKVHQGYRRFFKYGKGQILPYIRIDVTDLTREELFKYLLDLVKQEALHEGSCIIIRRIRQCCMFG